MGGFSLIEALVVIAILGILLSIAMPNVAAMRRLALDKTCRHELVLVRDAMNEWFKVHDGSYEGAEITKLGPYGYLHLDPKLVVNLHVEGPLHFTVTVTAPGIWRQMRVNSETGEITEEKP